MPRSRRSRIRYLAFALLTTTLCSMACRGDESTEDIGIHVGQPKIYDTRELTLIIDQLSRELSARSSFIDPKALATALGNIQGFEESQFSQSFLANGAVGPGAAGVFANAASGGNPPASTATPASTPASTTAPSVTINLTPTVNASSSPSSTTAAATPAASTAMPLGPQPPALPSLPTAPTYNPTLGLNASDLLSDEVNLTYQLSNVRLLLDRSLSDRLFYVGGEQGYASRLQAVVGFDVDLEQTKKNRDSVARVDVQVTAAGPARARCSTGPPSLVALMPEEGSHNAATLSQKANAFGGAIAASVFSIGYQAQSSSQVFYLYRDMDTVSFQNPHSNGKLEFGWQFRPVLGRHSIEPGLRHMIAVIGLPCPDEGLEPPKLTVHVEGSWLPYDEKTQTTKEKRHWWTTNVSVPSTVFDFPPIEAPSTDTTQRYLGPKVSSVKWIPTDSGYGVARVSGENFFLGTVVRIGAKTFASATDGLTLKSDHEFEVAMPLSVAVSSGGVVSGRYGNAIPLRSDDRSTELAPVFGFRSLTLLPEGNYMVQLHADLLFDAEAGTDAAIRRRNSPVLLVNGAPAPGLEPPTLSNGSSIEIAGKKFVLRALDAFVPAKALAEGPTVFTLVFPFEGARWIASMPYYDVTLKVTRLGGDDFVRLLISATNPADKLCSEWRLELDATHAFPLDAHGPLSCADPIRNVLSLQLPTKDLKPYRRFLLVDASLSPLQRSPLIGDIPPSEAPPPGPTLDKRHDEKTNKDVDQVQGVDQYSARPVKFTGTHLDRVQTVLWGATSLGFVALDDGKTIQINLTKEVVSEAPSKPGLVLMSSGNDPLIAEVQVNPAPKAAPVAQSPETASKPPKKEK
jgi:hypothetical protein